MNIFVDFMTLLLLFVGLGIAADYAVRNIKYIASVLKIQLFVFGIILGIITSLPELSVGISATLDKAGALSVGNTMGGILVMLGLILGASLLFNREIVSEDRLGVLLPVVGVIFSPIIMGLDGSYGLVDGLFMIALYGGLVYHLYRMNRSFEIQGFKFLNEKQITKSILYAIFGVIAVLFISHWIVEVTMDVLEHVNVSRLAIGTLVFAIGTNLPEITITFTSWRKKSAELSLSHLLSSSFTNVLVLGILTSIAPIAVTVGSTYWLLAFSLAVLLALFVLFCRSQKKLDHREGAALLAVYVAFLIANVWIR